MTTEYYLCLDKIAAEIFRDKPRLIFDEEFLTFDLLPLKTANASGKLQEKLMFQRLLRLSKYLDLLSLHHSSNVSERRQQPLIDVDLGQIHVRMEPEVPKTMISMICDIFNSDTFKNSAKHFRKLVIGEHFRKLVIGECLNTEPLNMFIKEMTKSGLFDCLCVYGEVSKEMLESIDILSSGLKGFEIGYCSLSMQESVAIRSIIRHCRRVKLTWISFDEDEDFSVHQIILGLKENQCLEEIEVDLREWNAARIPNSLVGRSSLKSLRIDETEEKENWDGWGQRSCCRVYQAAGNIISHPNSQVTKLAIRISKLRQDDQQQKIEVIARSRCLEELELDHDAEWFMDEIHDDPIMFFPSLCPTLKCLKFINFRDLFFPSRRDKEPQQQNNCLTTNLHSIHFYGLKQTYKNKKEHIVTLLKNSPNLGYLGKEFGPDSTVFSEEAQRLLDLNRVTRGKYLIDVESLSPVWNRIDQEVSDYRGFNTKSKHKIDPKEKIRTSERRDICRMSVVFLLLFNNPELAETVWPSP